MGGEKKKAARPLLKIRREISEPSDEFRFFLVFGQRGMQQVGSLNDTNMILRGAIPAAVLAIVVELVFAALERRVSPPR